MRHIAVRRLAVLLGGVFLLWAGVFAWIVGREPASPSATPAPPALATGAGLFERHCASCHAIETMRAAAGTDPDGTRRLDLEQLLEGHGEASADEDRQILDYLREPASVTSRAMPSRSAATSSAARQSIRSDSPASRASARATSRAPSRAPTAPRW